MFRLDGKIALVNGAGSSAPGWGNGKATAVVLARAGATVIASDVNLPAAVETQRLIEAEGGVCQVIGCDATDARQVERLVDDCVSRVGRIDILVNIVGQSKAGTAADMAEEVWDAQIELNLKTVFLACKYVLPVMERQGGGAIVNTSSVAGLRYVGKDQVAYSTAKAALLQFTRVTGVMYAPKNVRLNSVVPGLMNTPLMGRLATEYAGGDLQSLIAARNKQVPMGRMGDAWDVAYAVLFLVSDEARYVTATEIVVDGGFTARTP